MTAPVYLYPQPRLYIATGGSSPAADRFDVRPADGEAARLAAEAGFAERLTTMLAAAEGAQADVRPTVPAIVEYRAELHPQGYVLEWSAAGLHLAASTAQGLYYAALTAGQMIEGQDSSWEHCRIEDEPDFPVRGVMLDIGRNKIPKLETLFGLIDRLAELKINYAELYMEGFCFDYKKYASHFPDATPLTAAEYRELDAYAAARYIDLVPNQNCLGHMGEWLAKPEFHPLAEHPDGLPAPPPFPFKLPPSTMNPVDPRSAALAKDLFDELLPNFRSQYANINMDEPFGLGTGGSKARADEIGVGGLYLEYAERMFEIVRSHGKKPLMWGDVLAHHPETMKRLPADVTVLHWNYDAPVPYGPQCRALQENGIRYFVCPGTSTWAAITGRTDNMLDNIADAARSGKAYGAEGLIVTDWGDAGHWQALAFSYPGVAYAAGAAWNTETNLGRMEPLEVHVSARMLRDRSGGAGKFLLELGRYYHLERSTIENKTYTSYLLNYGLSSREELERHMDVHVQVVKLMGGSGTPFKQDYRYSEMELWLRDRRQELERLDFSGKDADLLRDELANALRLIEQGAGLHRYIFRQDLQGETAEIEWLEWLRAQLKTTVAEFQRLWLARNREGGLKASAAAFDKLLRQYGERLRELKEVGR